MQAAGATRARAWQVVVRAYEDRTFDFEVRQPNSSYFIRKAAELEKGASNPGHEVVGRLSVKQIYEIAQARPPPARRIDRRRELWPAHAHAGQIEGPALAEQGNGRVLPRAGRLVQEHGDRGVCG